jgi:lysophospholipase L1-like esterase
MTPPRRIRHRAWMRQGSGILARLLLSLVSVALCLLALEACVRLFFRDEIDPATLRRDLEGSSIRLIVEPSRDPALLFELRQDLFVRFHNTLVITGPGRYRIGAALLAGPAEATPAAGRRIAVLGDSTSFGWGVGYNESYPERYRRRMAEVTGVAVELRNYSVPAYNALQELRAFQTKVKAYRPDLLILHHDHNDADPTTKMMGADYMPVEYGDNPLHSALIKWSLRRLRRLRAETDRAAAEKGHRRVGGYIAAGPLYEAHLAARRELVEEATAMGIPVIVVIFNAWVSHDEHYETSETYTALHRDLGVRLSRMGYHVLDLYPAYQAALRDRGWTNLAAWQLSGTDGHPNADGHQFIAAQLVEYTLQHPDLFAVFKRTRDRRRETGS